MNFVTKFTQLDILTVADNTPIIAMVSLGRNSGLGQLKIGMLAPEWLVTKVKSANILVPKYWKNMHQPIPS